MRIEKDSNECKYITNRMAIKYSGTRYGLVCNHVRV